MLLAALESPAFYRLTVLIFNETSPKLLFVTPGYDYVQLAILLALAAAGGSVGTLFSRWRKRTCYLFLLAALSIIAAFDLLGVVLDAPRAIWDTLRFH
jgi:hypothetical protein